MRLICLVLGFAILSSLFCPRASAQVACDDALVCESCQNDAWSCDCDGTTHCDAAYDLRQGRVCEEFPVHRTPAMIGDFFSGSSARLSGSSNIDRLMVVANDLDASNPLPAGGSTLTITEPGPVGVFETSLSSIQQIQALLRAGTPLPAGTLEGTIADNAALTTGLTVSQIQTLLGSTVDAYDIISLLETPGTYAAAINAIFAARNGMSGTTLFNGDASGAVLQGGTDTLNGGEDFDAFYFYDYQVAVNLLLPQISGGGIGRLKLSEGGSVLPQDRVYFRYSYFDNVANRTNGVGVSRFTPGIERSFMDGLFSLELRAPFASRTVSDVSSNGAETFGSSSSEFGNLTLYLKALLLATDRGAISGGLGLELPTADGVSVSLLGTPLLNIDNDVVRLQPFLGMLHYHSDRLFSHGFMQFDFAAGNNDVSVNADGNGLRTVGSYSDRNNLFLDYGIGYWLYRSQDNKGLTGIIPTFEVHHTSSISDGKAVSAGPFTLAAESVSTTGLVAGSTFEFGQRNNLTVAYTDSIGDDGRNGGALRLMLSHQR